VYCRRLLFDDAFGVGEALNETAFGEGLVARGKHRDVTFEDISTIYSRMMWLLAHFLPPSPVSKLDRRHTGRLKKRDNLLT
jgi:hypothetical protein